MLDKNDPRTSREASHDIYWWQRGMLRVTLDHRDLPNRSKGRGRSGVYLLDAVIICKEYDKSRSAIVFGQLCQMSQAEYDREIRPLRRKYERHFRSALEAARFRLGAKPKLQKHLAAALKGWTVNVDLRELHAAMVEAEKIGGHTLVISAYRPKL